MSAFLSELRGGWRNLLAATIGLGFGIPCYTPVSSLFFRAVGRQFGWSKAVAAGALIALPIAALTRRLVPTATFRIHATCACVSPQRHVEAETLSLEDRWSAARFCARRATTRYLRAIHHAFSEDE